MSWAPYIVNLVDEVPSRRAVIWGKDGIIWSASEGKTDSEDFLLANFQYLTRLRFFRMESRSAGTEGYCCSI